MIDAKALKWFLVVLGGLCVIGAWPASTAADNAYVACIQEALPRVGQCDIDLTWARILLFGGVTLIAFALTVIRSRRRLSGR